MTLKQTGIIILCACIGIIFVSSNSQADPLLPTHSNDSWQNIAGVSWSVDGGSTWVTDAQLFVGQTIEFKFDMHKQNVGTHYADFLKAWLDWDGDEDFESNEVIGFYEEKLADNETGNMGSWNTPNNPDFTYYSKDYSSSTPYTLTNADIGDFWLLARVTCSESLLNASGISHVWDDQWDSPHIESYEDYFLATGHLYQGEAELYKLTVNPVPEPATMLLLGTGLVGIAGLRLRSKKK